METTCSSLLSELQKIWDEIGEADSERDRMLFELEQECLGAYKRKVDQANRYLAQLRQEVAHAEAQIAGICAALGERPAHVNQVSGSLKKGLLAITPLLEDLKKKRNERMCEFTDVQKQINSISQELSGYMETNLDDAIFDERDISIKKLEELQSQLLLLQKEKDGRLKQVHEQVKVLQSLCSVLGMESKTIVQDVHPTLHESCSRKSISVDTLKKISATICMLHDTKLQRLQKLQDITMTMVELWNLMGTPVEEQQMFQNVTRTIAASENEVTDPNSLSLELINNAEAEVTKLQEMKVRKIKEIFTKRKLVLEEIYRESHMAVEDPLGTDLSLDSVDSGSINVTDLLERLDVEIAHAKEEALSRTEILGRVQKWLAACEEERWLEEYNRDDNRYTAGRGTHLMLKRAERARVLVNKIPGMVDALKSKAQAWEKERNKVFLYDGVTLTSMLDRYNDLKNLKEQERQRQRDQKKVQGQIIAEQEAIYGAEPTPSKCRNKNIIPSSVGVGDKRLSVGEPILQKKLADKVASHSSQSLSKNKPINKQPYHSSGTNKTSGGGLAKTNPSNSTNHELLQLRKALSPLSSLSSNIISYNLQDLNTKSAADYKSPSATPLRSICNSENLTPKTLPIPTPATPTTASVMMQTAASPFAPSIRDVKEAEYSYEERRAGFAMV